MNRKVGRPTKYDPIFISQIDEYLKTTGGAQMHLPKVVSFARYIGVNKSSLYEWAEQHKEFSNALEKIMNYQEETLIDDGIYGGKEVNSTIVKLLLMNNHGMKEREDHTSDDKPLSNLIQVNESNQSITLANGGSKG